MKCPNCKNEVNNNKKCPYCGVDVKIFKYVNSISAKLYNKGLDEARDNDLSRARKSLEESIKYNKANIEARNLLGLVYYEMGYLADAVKQWIVSSNIQKEDNKAEEYINYFQDNIREFESIDDSIKMYNAAIEFASNKNDDIAVIRLKKAVDINPKFIDAYNLMALCYLMQKNYEKAAEAVSKVLLLDKNNPTALGYLKEIGIDSVRNVNAAAVRKSNNTRREIIRPIIDLNNTKANKWKNAIMFAAGCICTAIVMGVLIIPGIIEKYDSEAKELKKQLALLKEDYQSLNSYEESIETTDRTTEETTDDITTEESTTEETTKEERIIYDEVISGGGYMYSVGW